ncbi:DUF2326 domain-containing protein [Vibrio kanaloae]|uniref:Flagellar protein FlgN n=1 Tax=Vibrio kanaloae TaxID=170673 RepID=A0A4U1YWD3_9VIBR|nr:DUF2326 domain-containing protein [Vibrio kanaloae]TKF25109.1 flagellar protein FlgN [Vibrio kanaloae]
MMIDFCFGGDDFLKTSADVFIQVGHLEIDFTFEFDKVLYKFKRSTSNPKVVIFNNDIENPKTVSDLRAFLKSNYNCPNALSFRELVNLTSRIWGKGNFNPNLPLNFDNSRFYDQTTKYLLVLFDLYNDVSKQRSEQANLESRKSSLKGAFDQDLIARKLKKTELEPKKKELLELEDKTETLKTNLSKYTTNISEIVNQRSLSIKKDKDLLLKLLDYEEQRLFRTEKSLAFGSFANKKQFSKLVDYFPNVNLEKLKKIERFHSGVTKLLKNEIKVEKLSIEQNIQSYKEQISDLDTQLEEVFKLKEKPSLLIDDLLSLTIKTKEIKQQIDYRELSDSIDEKVKIGKEEGKRLKLDKLEGVSNILYEEIADVISTIYEDPAIPHFIFSDKNYEFSSNGDTGTGKCFSNMISLDISLLMNTKLPFFIHDSAVLKNIEVNAVNNIVNNYNSITNDKQIFISIDEITKYSTKTQKIIAETEFLTLSSSKLAFNKKWEKQ